MARSGSSPPPLVFQGEDLRLVVDADFELRKKVEAEYAADRFFDFTAARGEIYVAE